MKNMKKIIYKAIDKIGHERFLKILNSVEFLCFLCILGITAYAVTALILILN